MWFKQTAGWGCVSNYGLKPCNLQRRTASSQGNLDKSRLVITPHCAWWIMPSWWVVVCTSAEIGNCVAQMGDLNTAEPLSDGYIVQVQSAND